MSTPTKTLLDQEAHEAILKGVNAVYHPVLRTIGPEGKNALVYGTFNQEPRFTNCGNIIGGVQEPQNIHQRLVANAFQETCKKTDEKVGDGRTATIVLGGKLYNEAYKKMSKEKEHLSMAESKTSVGVQTLKKEILETANKVKEQIKKVAKKVEGLEDLEKIASVSVQDKEIGKLIAKMSWEAGPDSFVSVLDGHRGKIETEIVPGMSFPAKVSDNAFLTDLRTHSMKSVDCPVVITNHDLTNTQQVYDALKNVYNKYKKIIIIANGYSNEVLGMLWNSMVKQGVATPDGRPVRNGFEIYPVKCPALRKEQLEDIAIYCDARLIDKKKGDKFENIVPCDLGFLERLTVMSENNNEDAQAIGGDGNKLEKMIKKEEEVGIAKEEKKRTKTPIEERINDLKGQLKNEKKGKMWQNLLKRRIASMSSSHGIIRVGAPTKAEAHYLQLKIQDAVNACKASLKGGYVKGGGLCLKEISDKLPKENIMKEVLAEPYRLIQASGDIKITDDIIDPADVIYYAVENSVSVVANLITCDILTAETEPINPVYGSYAIADALWEFVVTDKINKGQIKENEAEMWKDGRQGMTQDEFNYDKDKQVRN